MMQVDLTQLRIILMRIMDHIIETRDIKSVSIDESFYWTIPDTERYDMNADSESLDVGSLADDWEFISSLLNEENQPVAYQLTEVGPLLIYIGEVLNECLGKEGG